MDNNIEHIEYSKQHMKENESIVDERPCASFSLSITYKNLPHMLLKMIFKVFFMQLINCKWVNDSSGVIGVHDNKLGWFECEKKAVCIIL